MGGRALGARFGAAFQAFLLAACIASVTDLAGTRAEETPEASVFPSPGDTDEVFASPAAAPAGESETDAVPAAALSGEAETWTGPAAAPADDVSRSPAEATLAATTPGDTIRTEADPIVAEIRLRLQDPELRKRAYPGDLAALEAFYGALGGPPLWITGMGFSARAQSLIAEIHDADDWGLDAEAFDLPDPSNLPPNAEAQAIDEIRLSLAALKYARFARGGRLSPSRISELFDQRPTLVDPSTILAEIAVTSDPGGYLRGLHPNHEQFEKLRAVLIKTRAGSKARGRGPASTATIQRLIVNMERWRWMPANLGSYYVWNNIPAFTTRVVKRGKSVYVEKTIVGQLKYATPIFSANMNSIVFNPEWTVPETIKLEDLRPRLRQTGASGRPDVSVLNSNKLSVSYQGRPVDALTVDWANANILNYTFTQAPGPDNVLGAVKFNFPNRHAIYMHDTIQPELFRETVRTLSHGCIRVNQPARLAALLLAEDKGWSEQRVKDLLARGNNSAVPLGRPVPVHLTYFTMAFDGAGKLQTYPDIYGLDKKMAAALFGKSQLQSAETLAAGKPQARRAANAGLGRANQIPGLFGN